MFINIIVMYVYMSASEIEELRARFLSAYANLPEPECEQVIVVINNKSISWNKAYNEIINKTSLGNEILIKLKKLEIL